MTAKNPRSIERETLFPVADLHGRCEPASRIRLVDWLRVPSISGLQCAQALQRAGFVVSARLPGCVELRREERAIQVPLADRLEAAVLATILQKANVPASTFLALLDA